MGRYFVSRCLTLGNKGFLYQEAKLPGSNCVCACVCCLSVHLCGIHHLVLFISMSDSVKSEASAADLQEEAVFIALICFVCKAVFDRYLGVPPLAFY